MSDKKTGISTLIDELGRVDPMAIADYETDMKEHGIPEIVRAVERRRMLADESRQRRLELPEPVRFD